MGRLAWHALIAGGWPEVAPRYVFNTRALTNDAPYFAAYVKTGDLPRVTDRLELLQDEWGYLLTSLPAFSAIRVRTMREFAGVAAATVRPSA